MDLPITAVREQLESLLNPASGRGVRIDFDVAEQAGLTIVERRIPALDLAYNYKCTWFVFGKTLQEPWFTPHSFSKDLLDDPTNFLGKYGFNLVHTPLSGDIVAYVSLGKTCVQAHHFGIFDAGKVRSKFGVGHIFKHEMIQVPTSYGEKVLFYRKQEKSELPTF